MAALVASAPTSAALASPALSPAAQSGYGGAERPPALSPTEARAAAAIRGRPGAAPPVADAALCTAARALAARAARAGKAAAATEGEAVEQALGAAGVHDAAPVPIAIRGSSLQPILARLSERSLQEAQAPEPGPDRFGIGVVSSEGQESVVLLLVRRRATLDPFPREAAVGAAPVLSGRVLSPLTAAELVVTPPDGTPRRIPSEVPPPAFRARLPLLTRGRTTVEVLGQGPRGPEVAALLRVHVGQPFPEAPAPARARPEPDDRPGKERTLGEEVASLRAARGLPPLALDPELAAVARAYAEELSRTGRFAHHSAITGAVGDRLRTAGYLYVRAAENLAQAPTIRLAHRSTVESPGHLQNLLDPGWTHAGYGVAEGVTPGGARTFFAVELFSVPAKRSRDPAADAAAAVAAERREQGLPAFLRDGRLDALARDEAAALVAADDLSPRGNGPSLAKRALAGLGAGGAVEVELLVASRPEQILKSRRATSERFGRLGLAAATLGERSKLGAGQLLLVVVYARVGGTDADE